MSHPDLKIQKNDRYVNIREGQKIGQSAKGGENQEATWRPNSLAMTLKGPLVIFTPCDWPESTFSRSICLSLFIFIYIYISCQMYFFSKIKNLLKRYVKFR